MPSWPGSLRVRLTVLVVVAVGLALAAASVLLVTGLSRSLVGDAEELARAEVDEVADALRSGHALPAEPRAEALTVIQIQDGHGRVVQQIPDAPARTITIDQLPKELRDARAAALDDGDGDGTSRAARPTDDVVLAWRTVSTPDGTRTVLALSRLGPITASVQVVVDALLVGAPLLVVFVGALTWFAVHRALRPIEAVRRHADAISHSSLDDRLPPPSTRDEVARLTSTLNEMLDRIGEGARRQREFVADASHELRTPLAAMRADLEVALAHPDGTDWQVTARRLIDDHRRLDRLTGDLLMLARLDDATGAAGGRRLERVRLDEVVAGELAVVRRAALDVDVTPVVVTGVVPELARLARNLLDNADRHAATRVVVRLSADGDAAVFTVDDDGPGIPAGQRDRVFDRFYRPDSSRGRDSGGTGLGLAMVRRIAQAHGGAVDVGVSPLGGARFLVRLPRSAKDKVG
ncbi:HAMP domain-containing sensor histidine kinase [Actinophytocola sediminis]